ncbi:sensor histidine kinase [Alkalihalobacillus sp. LMS39]|uniref:ATP-binding protein n=1 Tax=Alkalihalobacillus sp. LMS39 TaxID=2924032 RepID=UPI001FB4C5BE|nr:sensor histidine kinase [Alkalihalobacillus sp. LMS39]UOE95221.1 sensor histidine kinase [Alkalihalobacillus sp. LMS39]
MKISLRMKMLTMSFIVVTVSIIVSGYNMVYKISNVFEKELSERAIAIARTVAQMPDIHNNVGISGGENMIQTISERTRLATNVDYIVIIDMNSIRYSHPNESLIGKKFVGGDEVLALAHQEYISKAEGTLGYAVRAFVPIMNEDGDEQVGVAVVGLLMPTFQSLLAEYRNDILLSLGWGLIIGLLGSVLLANNIKKQTFNLEPYEIARLVKERSAVMEAMDIGVIALNEQGYMTFMNQLAKEYTHSKERSKTPLHVKDIFPKSWDSIFSQLDTKGERGFNQNIVLYNQTYLINMHHIDVDGRVEGSLITMVDRTEANRLAEELTGVKTFVDSLRAQNHEYMNKLHSIAGLIQLDKTERALEVIIDETTDEEETIQFLKERISDYSVSGLLLGKRARARELGIQFTINKESYLHCIYHGLSSGDIITILGNLIENAFEAHSVQQKNNKLVDCMIQGNENSLCITVKDQGRGIPKEEQERIFTYGFSTKREEGHGIGLALVQQIVIAHQGEIIVDSETSKGTKIIIKIERGMSI